MAGPGCHGHPGARLSPHRRQRQERWRWRYKALDLIDEEDTARRAPFEEALATYRKRSRGLTHRKDATQVTQRSPSTAKTIAKRIASLPSHARSAVRKRQRSSLSLSTVTSQESDTKSVPELPYQSPSGRRRGRRPSTDLTFDSAVFRNPTPTSWKARTSSRNDSGRACWKHALQPSHEMWGRPSWLPFVPCGQEIPRSRTPLKNASPGCELRWCDGSILRCGPCVSVASLRFILPSNGGRRYPLRRPWEL